MEYTAIETFMDRATAKMYYTGDAYPAAGHSVSDERIAQLLGDNRYARPFIRPVEEPEQAPNTQTLPVKRKRSKGPQEV